MIIIISILLLVLLERYFLNDFQDFQGLLFENCNWNQNIHVMEYRYIPLFLFISYYIKKYNISSAAI